MRLTAAARALIGSPLSQSEFAEPLKEMRRLLETLESLEQQAAAGGGPRGHHRHCVVNKKVAPRRRMSLLFDAGRYYEMNRLAGYGMEYGTVPAAGTISGVGLVSDRLCLASANDATVKGGTVYPIGVKKTLRLQEFSGECRIPVVYLVDSGGAFLPLQSEIFPDAHHGGRTFFNEATLNAGGVSQLALVLGSATAGGAYVPTMCEEVAMVEGVGRIFLGGPPLVRAALGETVTADELGGARLHCSVSGCSDHLADTEEAAFRLLREVAATLPQAEATKASSDSGSFARPAFAEAELDCLGLNLLQGRQRRRLALRNIAARIVDASNVVEFKALFGDCLLCGFAALAGRTIGLIGSCGPISETDAIKGAHFLQLCGHRSLPVVFLCHTEPEGQQQQQQQQQQQPESAALSAAAAVKAKAKMLALVATYPLPKICVLVGDAAGCDYYLMCGRSQSPTFLLSWPNASVSCGLSDAGDEEKVDAFRAAGQLWVDDVIRPRDTRQHIAQLLQFATNYSQLPRHTRTAARQQGDSFCSYWPAYPTLRM